MPAPPAGALAEALRPLLRAPERAAVLCDVDGTLAPIVARPEDAAVPASTRLLLERLRERYAVVACVSGRRAEAARALVGIGDIFYAGAHGAELLPPGAGSAEIVPEFAAWERRVKDHVGEVPFDGLGVQVEDKGPIVGLHWRRAPDPERAVAALERVAAGAEAAGLATHWGRMVLELRPPVAIDKGRAVRLLVERSGARTALFGGDDRTDLDAFSELDALAREGDLDTAVRVGVSSPEGPPEITDRADVVVEGTAGFAELLAVLAEAGA